MQRHLAAISTVTCCNFETAALQDSDSSAFYFILNSIHHKYGLFSSNPRDTEALRTFESIICLVNCQKRCNISLASRRWASSVTPQSSASDPAEAEALRCLEQGTAKLEEGDVEGAKELYKRSCEIKRTASSLFNLGVTYYHLKEYDDAISAWKESIALQPSSPDAHTRTAYIISPVSRPDLALHHLEIASSLSPEDPEIAFNHAAVLEATGRLEEALEKYKLSEQFGVARASVHIRNISAKILAKRAPTQE
ncbi:hypothetical protein D9613_006726 [Agrocybe pediades]|uniref:TPR-like protein n=1 Tax=Agrocybe pediades TaxID=84607 RepID=A0A8H4QGU8_9AGAR|nr:hypothetical protein D9613_006726 [Agrocybe pediades]